MMKKLLFILLFLVLIFGAYAQGGTTGASWSLTGNERITDRNFLGTNDCKPLVFKTNETERMRLLEDRSFLGIGLSTPLASLHLHYQKDSLSCNQGFLSNIPPEPPQSYSGSPLFRLTTSTTGMEDTCGFKAVYFGKSIIFNQQEQANFILQGPAGGLTIAPNGEYWCWDKYASTKITREWKYFFRWGGGYRYPSS